MYCSYCRNIIKKDGIINLEGQLLCDECFSRANTHSASANEQRLILAEQACDEAWEKNGERG